MGLNDRRGLAFVTVDGADSRWEVGTDLDMGQNGFSTIEVRDGGTLDVSGTVFVQSHGAITGNGTLHAGGRVVNGGNLTVENVAGEIDANNTNGSVTVTNVTGSVLANSKNGKVTV